MIERSELTIVWRSPTARVDGHVLEAVVERSSLVYIRDCAGKDADPRDFGFIGDTDTACGVLSSGDLTRTPRTVCIVGQLGRRQRFVIIEVVRIIGVLGRKFGKSAARIARDARSCP